jgi:hypothetical protein
LVEEGTHRELVTAGGRYAALYRSWLGNVREGEVASAAEATAARRRS